MPSYPATLTWDANTESDLNGYKIYSRQSIFVPFGSPITVGVTGGSGTTGAPAAIMNLQNLKTTYIAITAFDVTGNESAFSGQESLAVNLPLTTVRRSFK